MSEQTECVTGRRDPKIDDLIQKACHLLKRYILCEEDGSPRAVLMSYEDYCGLTAAAELARQPDAVRDILLSIEEIEKGETVAIEEGIGWLREQAGKRG